MIGFVAGRVVQKSEDQASLPLKVMSKAANLRGVLVGSVAQYVLSFAVFLASVAVDPRPLTRRYANRFEDLMRALAVNKIHPVVDKVFDFEDAVAAYRHLESQKHVGKVVIRVAKK